MGEIALAVNVGCAGEFPLENIGVTVAASARQLGAAYGFTRSPARCAARQP